MSFPRTILLVDDEAHIRTYVTLILRQLGATAIVEAGDGEEAVAAYERARPDLVLLDISMPVVDGLETLRRLKRLDPACVVVMLTGIVNRRSVDEAYALGAASYLRKDLPKEEIAAMLQEAIADCFDAEPDPPP